MNCMAAMLIPAPNSAWAIAQLDAEEEGVNSSSSSSSSPLAGKETVTVVMSSSKAGSSVLMSMNAVTLSEVASTVKNLSKTPVSIAPLMRLVVSSYRSIAKLLAPSQLMLSQAQLKVARYSTSSDSDASCKARSRRSKETPPSSFGETLPIPPTGKFTFRSLKVDKKVASTELVFAPVGTNAGPLVGSMVGVYEGSSVVPGVGTSVGVLVGALVGCSVGGWAGTSMGELVGIKVGPLVGECAGSDVEDVGSRVDPVDGAAVASDAGVDVAASLVDSFVGLDVGSFVGLDVGPFAGTEVPTMQIVPMHTSISSLTSSVMMEQKVSFGSATLGTIPNSLSAKVSS